MPAARDQDKRRRCRATPPDPSDKMGRQVSVYLTPEDYRLLYEITMRRGVSMREALRQIIRESA